jgi:hypothetical protein
MNRFRIIEVTYAQKYYEVNAKSKNHALRLHLKGDSSFVNQGGCLDGEIVNTEIERVKI